MYRRGGGDEICPNCFQILIELGRFDARDDAVSVDRGGWSGGGKTWWETDYSAEFADQFLGGLRASFYQWRLRRVLRKWPRSLYCSACGYFLKR